MAEQDLSVAGELLRADDEWAYPATCFHAQQCVEKYLKAILVSRSLRFPPTHVLARLLRLLPPDSAAPLSAAQARLLTRYAVETRYPGGADLISQGEAQQAVALARRVAEFGRLLLGKLEA